MNLLYNKPLSLYLHIPFCTTKCTYCAFNTYTNLERLIPDFVQALIKEVGFVGKTNPHSHITSVYFGGGTPSLLTAFQLKQILEQIHKCFPVSANCEITMEANPIDLTEKYVEELLEIGINRLSIGVQSTHEHELTLFARRHNSEVATQAFNLARQHGFKNISLDLIYGIPNQTLEQWKVSVDHILALSPEHISMYSLGLEDGTPMKNWVQIGKLPTPDDDVTADMYELATDLMLEKGYEQYEISNWSKPNLACEHNLQYWRNFPYLGLGSGAHGYAGGKRYSTIRSPKQYIDRLLYSDDIENVNLEFPLTPVVDEFTDVQRQDEISETLMTGLRLTQTGITHESFHERFGVSVHELHSVTLNKFIKHGLLQQDEKSIRITRRGRLLSNAIFRELV